MTKLIEELAAELIRQAYAEGYRNGQQDAVDRSDVNPFKLGECSMETPQAKRDRIVEQAKADVKKENAKRLAKQADETIYYYTDRIDYVVNRDKRTVVALFYSEAIGVITRGIAKCAPGDCFNVWIGKAIALRRALGLDIPFDYLTVPNPTEVRVGDVIRSVIFGYVNEVVEINDGEMWYDDGQFDLLELIPKETIEIIDDSREEVSE